MLNLFCSCIRLPCAPFCIVGIQRCPYFGSQHCVVKAVHNVPHRDNRAGGEAIGLADGLEGRLGIVGGGPLHPVKADDFADDLHLCLRRDEGVGLFNGLTRSSHVLDDDDLVPVVQGAAEKHALVCPVVLRFLAVGAVADFFSVQLAVGFRGADRKRDALIGGTEEDIRLIPEVVVDGAGVKLAELPELTARHVAARIHEERGLPAALEGKRTELEYSAGEHEFYKVFLVLFHSGKYREKPQKSLSSRSGQHPPEAADLRKDKGNPLRCVPPPPFLLKPCFSGV